MSEHITGIIFFGDSVFFGVGASERSKSCYKIFKKHTPLPTLLRAKSQDTLINAKKRLENDVLAYHRFSHVFIMFGNNDSRLTDEGKPCVSQKIYEKYYTEIIAKIKKNKQTPISVGLQPVNVSLIRDEALKKHIKN
ncbi:MAG: GDSL-type esterase/lipase family protein [bacterium]